MTRTRPPLEDVESPGGELFGAPAPAPVVDPTAAVGVTVERRAEWGALPPKGNPGGFASLAGTVCHYTAANRGYMVEPWEPHTWCQEQVRSIQRQHQAIAEQSDIEYNALACAHGVLFEGRVLGYKGGANGSASSNANEPSVCALVGVDDVPPQALLEVLAAFHAEVQRRAGRDLVMVKHSDRFATSCPGAFLSRWVDTGGWRAAPAPRPPQEDDMPRIGPYLIQATGADGTPTGAVYATDGNMMTLRLLATTEALEGYRWTMTHYGASAPELAPGAPIEPIDTIAAYGVVLE